MLNLQNIKYIHPNKNLLFDSISLSLNTCEKVALIGKNGSGKSSLLKIITGHLKASEGELLIQVEPYYVPQIYGQFNHFTIAQALGVDKKIEALTAILKGDLSELNYTILTDDWTIEERCMMALKEWKLDDLNLNQKLESLSGGQKTKVFLAGMTIHQSKFILLDEPSNHLDIEGRELLYQFIKNTSATLLIVSHDRKLLNLLEKVLELNSEGIEVYGGNYDFYLEQKEIRRNALESNLFHQEKELRKAKEKERESLERKQKLDNRGKAKHEKAGVARIMLNTLKNKAENSSSKLKEVHSERIAGINKDLYELRAQLPENDKMKVNFHQSSIHKGKILVEAKKLNIKFSEEFLWSHDLDFHIRSAERIVLTGLNGSGKTSLIHIITNKLKPSKGSLQLVNFSKIYIDQDYSILNNKLSVYDQAQYFNDSALLEHEVKIRLHRFLFDKNEWDESVNVLSGGEKMRLTLCCLSLSKQAPDLIILDEPTNNLDIQNVGILTRAIKEYEGTLIVVSHDEVFLNEIKIDRSIELPNLR